MQCILPYLHKNVHKILIFTKIERNLHPSENTECVTVLCCEIQNTASYCQMDILSILK